MQTILGAGGAIGRELAKALPKYTQNIRLVSRNPEKVNESDQLFAADLTDKDEVLKAVEGSEIVYLTVGLPYNAKVWEQTWPVIIDNVLEACKVHQSKLVFFDNIYMYDPKSVSEIRETNPVNPQSRKGKVRAAIARKVTDACDGAIETLIARSADFYGPSIENVSVLTETVFKPLSEGKKASCLGSVHKIHSFTYTPDSGKAVALLGNTPDAYGETWHLPTSNEKWTMRQFIEWIADGFNVEPKFQVAGRFMVSLLGLFVPIMREMKEMLYQYEQDYFFISEKFEERFDFKPTTFKKGIAEILKIDYDK